MTINNTIQAHFKKLSAKFLEGDITDAENRVLANYPLIYPELSNLFPDLMARLRNEARENRFLELDEIMEEGSASSLEKAEYRHLKKNYPELETLAQQIRMGYEAIKFAAAEEKGEFPKRKKHKKRPANPQGPHSTGSSPDGSDDDSDIIYNRTSTGILWGDTTRHPSDRCRADVPRYTTGQSGNNWADYSLPHQSIDLAFGCHGRQLEDMAKDDNLI